MQFSVRGQDQGLSLYFDNLDPIRALTHRIAHWVAELSARLVDSVNRKSIRFLSGSSVSSGVSRDDILSCAISIVVKPKSQLMPVRVVTLNLEQGQKRWAARRPLIAEEIGRLKPDIIAFNEVSVPLQSARSLRNDVRRSGIEYNLVQQTRVNGLSKVEGEALLTRFAVIESANLDYQTRDMVALVARVLIGGVPLDVYVTHLYMSRGDDSLRLFQVQQLLAWMGTREEVPASIVCGDFNARLDAPSATLMASRFRVTQTSPTAFTPLADYDGSVSHPYWPRMDRCIDYIWVSGAVEVVASGVCFDHASPDDSSLWPSDHAGVWADLECNNAS